MKEGVFMSKNYLIPVTHFEKEIMTEACGSYITDTTGKKYLDLNSGQFCTILGHSNKFILDEISRASAKMVHTASNIISEDVLTAATNLHRISGTLNGYSIMLSTGAESVEFAIRYAKHITGRPGVLCFDKGYHGLTLGAQSVTYSGVYATPRVDNIYTIPVPDTFCSDSELNLLIIELENILKNNADKIACVLMEPIVSVGGMIIPPSKWFKNVRRLCDEFNILLIYDESQTGFGRTGNWFAYQTFDAPPHIVTTAKGVGLGYPVSVVIFDESIVPDSTFAMSHYSSHQNDSFAANIINAGIKYIEDNNILDDVKIKGKYFKEQLVKLNETSDYVTSPRGCGLMLGIDLNIDGIENYRPVYQKLYRTMMDKVVLIQGTNGGKTLRFLPDYLISYEDIDFALSTLADSLNSELLS